MRKIISTSFIKRLEKSKRLSFVELLIFHSKLLQGRLNKVFMTYYIP
jgi:hypothetical protein